MTMNISKIKELDLFYTKHDVALECYNITINILSKYINKNTLWIEPSAGNGSFLNIINGKKIGFDIYPQNASIKKLDFLNDNSQLENIKNSIVIGNPPFGKRAKSAVLFFNKSALLSNHIAFIVPNQFRKYSVQSKLNDNFYLIYELELDENSFLVNGKDYKARCVFQVWTKEKTGHNDIRIREKPPTTHKDFEIFQYNNTKEALKYFDKKKYGWDFAVIRQGFYDYKIHITNEKELNKKIQYAFFKANNKNVLSRLKKINFEKLAKNNTVILGFGKHDVVKAYIDKYSGAT